mmetsp:Transcript_10494/g.25425  ORF Transcript_10494/g.25425 Transcript_10494/m.25425 type:complete len:82 (-) Transcript_10494:720-965(-)
MLQADEYSDDEVDDATEDIPSMMRISMTPLACCDSSDPPARQPRPLTQALLPPLPQLAPFLPVTDAPWASPGPSPDHSDYD